MNSASEFVSEAIRDTQATIRAIDVKIVALLAAILVPLSATGRIFAHVGNFGKLPPSWASLVINCLFLAAWFWTLYLLAKAIGAVDNPVAHVPNSKNLKGAFYGGGNFPFKRIDGFINRKSLIATKGIAAYLQEIPTTDEEILAELVFEQMKLAYIRDIKMLRLALAYRFAAAWVVLGVIVYLGSRYIVG